MADKRTYKDFRSRTESKRHRKSDRIPGDQFDPDLAAGGDFLNIEEDPMSEEAVPVDEGEIEVVSFEPEFDVQEFEPGETEAPPSETEETPEVDLTSAADDDYPEVDESDVEEEYYDAPEEDEGPQAEPYAEEEPAGAEEGAYAAGDKDPREEEGCMMKTTGSFEERLRQAMNLSVTAAEPGEELAAELGEEAVVDVPMGEVEPLGEEMPGEAEGPCPAGCEPSTVKEEPMGEDEGILDVGEDEVEFVDEAGGAEEKEGYGRPRAPEAVAMEEEEMDVEEPVEAAVEEEPEPQSTDAIYETLGNIEALADVQAEQVDLILTREESDDPQYVVLVDGNPLAKVALSDQPESLTTDHPEMFLDEDYPRFVLEGINNFGLDQTLKSINARYYAAAAQEGALAEQMKTAAAHQLEGEHRIRLAEMKETLLNTANIVLEGSIKNYILDNPLRDEMVRLMKSAGVDESAAIDIFETAFRSKGPETIQAIFTKAEEWMGAPEGVMEHHINEITKMNYRHPGYSEQIEEDIPQEPAPVEARYVPQSVPVRTVASTQQRQPAADQYDKEYWKKQLNLHGNLVQASMTNKPGGRFGR